MPQSDAQLGDDRNARLIELEERVRNLEVEIASLKAALAQSRPNAWVEEIAGRFVDDPVYDEAMRLGAAWRRRENLKSLRSLDRQAEVDADPRHRPSDGHRPRRRRPANAPRDKS